MDPFDKLEIGADEADGSVASNGIPADDPPADDGQPTVVPTHDLNAVRSIYERESYAWALDIFFVYENLGVAAKTAKAFTPARQALLRHAKQDMANFMGQLLPKAMQLLEKANEKHGDIDSVITEERKGIQALRNILRDAIEEAKGVTVG